jgi:hypothetical protein
LWVCVERERGGEKRGRRGRGKDMEGKREN